MACIFEGVLACLAFVASGIVFAGPATYSPVQWTRFVQVEGDSEPVPEQWLQDEEARIAYSLKLPAAVPRMQPFDVPWTFGGLRRTKAAVEYFNHLCRTEAGEWIFKTVDKVEGFYFARPQGAPGFGVMTDPYGPEMPWIQRLFALTGDGLRWQGGWFISPPSRNYLFVEQPRRKSKWQASIQEPYVQLFGFTTELARDINGKLTNIYRQVSPMQAVGIPAITARYGYTWRGLKRPRDRELGIAGGELIIYDLNSREVLAVRRQFLIAGYNPRGEGKAMWETAIRCPQLPTVYGTNFEFAQFAFDTLRTVQPSYVEKKPER